MVYRRFVVVMFLINLPKGVHAALVKHKKPTTPPTLVSLIFNKIITDQAELLIRDGKRRIDDLSDAWVPCEDRKRECQFGDCFVHISHQLPLDLAQLIAERSLMLMIGGGNPAAAYLAAKLCCLPDQKRVRKFFKPKERWQRKVVNKLYREIVFNVWRKTTPKDPIDMAMKYLYEGHAALVPMFETERGDFAIKLLVDLGHSSYEKGHFWSSDLPSHTFYSHKVYPLVHQYFNSQDILTSEPLSGARPYNFYQYQESYFFYFTEAVTEKNVPLMTAWRLCGILPSWLALYAEKRASWARDMFKTDQTLLPFLAPFLDSPTLLQHLVLSQEPRVIEQTKATLLAKRGTDFETAVTDFVKELANHPRNKNLRALIEPLSRQASSHITGNTSPALCQYKKLRAAMEAVSILCLHPLACPKVQRKYLKKSDWVALAIALSWYFSHSKTFFYRKKSNDTYYNYLEQILKKLKAKDWIQFGPNMVESCYDQDSRKKEISLRAKYWVSHPALLFEGLAVAYRWRELAWCSTDNLLRNLLENIPDEAFKNIKMFGDMGTLVWDLEALEQVCQMIHWVEEENTRRHTNSLLKIIESYKQSYPGFDYGF